jgi:tetratricopeptide (TPR) repeat protein
VQPDSKLADALAAFQQGDLERARTLAEALFETEAESPQLLHLLGLIDCRSGNLQGGVERLRRATDAEPDNVSFRVMFARALTDSGRADEALAIATLPTGTSPAELALWHARAEAAQACSNHAIAAPAWKVMCAARPTDWRAWANYGEALAKLERWREAVNALRRASTLNPAELPIQLSFATALARSGSFEEAVNELKLVLDTGPDNVGIRLTLSRLLADLGRYEDSMAELDQAARLAVGESSLGQGSSGLIRIALGGRDGRGAPISAEELRAVRELALLLERTNRMDALRNLLDDAEQLGIARDQLGYPAAAIALREGDGEEARRVLALESPETDPVRWHHLMAKILDSLGDPEGAFAEAEVMNRSISDIDVWLRRGDEYRRWVHSFADAVTPQWVAELRPLEAGGRPPPAFLVGFPRSGTTLLDTFLMGHPGTIVVEEHQMLEAAGTVLGNVSELPLRSQEQLEEARRAYFAELDLHADPDFPGLIVDKLPLNVLGLPVIYSLFPDARVIFAQRHPCDVVLSCFMQSFMLNDAMACFLTIEHGAELYDAAMRLFTRSREALPIAVHTLVYEELVANPGGALRPLIDFLGLDWHPELLDHRTTAKARGAISTPSYNQVTEPVHQRSSGRWRRYEEQMRPALPILVPWARRLGYPD